MHSFPRKTETSVDSFQTAFAIPWGLVKLIQGFWLLDHNDYEVSMLQFSYAYLAVQSYDLQNDLKKMVLS